MRFIIRDDAEQASIYVASYIVDRIKHFNPTPSNPFVLGLPTGSSPLGVYKFLVEKYKAGEVSLWQTVLPESSKQYRILADRNRAVDIVRKCRHFQHG